MEMFFCVLKYFLFEIYLCLTSIELAPGAADGRVGGGGREAEVGGRGPPGGGRHRPRRRQEALHQPPLLLPVLLPARTWNVFSV